MAKLRFLLIFSPCNIVMNIAISRIFFFRHRSCLFFVFDFCFSVFSFFSLQLAWEHSSTSSGRSHQPHYNTPPCHPRTLICSKCVHSSASWREFWKQLAVSFSWLIGSAAHMIPEIEGPQRPVQTLEERSV